jgi:hypothetical protein
MALVLADRVQETATANTTVSFSLAGASTGYTTFSAAVGNTNTTYYGATDGTNWEVGIGTYATTGNLLNRTTILTSSNSNAAVTFSGTVTVFVDYPAGKSAYQDANGLVTVPSLATTASVTASGNKGAISYGTLNYSDTNIIASFQSSIAGYNQIILQNTSSNAAASTNFNISNDGGTSTTNFGEFGINSSTFSGTGAFNAAGSVYLASASTDLAIGTYGSNAIHFVVNSGATDAATISSAGLLTANSFASSSAAITGGSINGTTLGASTASTGRFTSITATTGTITPATGTASVAPISLTSGTNLTSAVAGAIEYDGAVGYFTPDTTIGRGFIPSTSTFRLTAAGGAITTIANVFGTTSNIPLVSGAFYEIDIYILALKTTAGAVTVTLTNSAAPTLMFVDYEQSPLSGVATPPGSVTALTNINFRGTTTTTTAAYNFNTGTLATGVNHYLRFKLLLNNNTGTSLKIQLTSGTGSITPQAGSVWFARRLPGANTGTFAA